MKKVLGFFTGKNVVLAVVGIVCALAMVTIMNVFKVKPLEKSVSNIEQQKLAVEAVLDSARGAIYNLNEAFDSAQADIVVLNGSMDSLDQVIIQKDVLADKLAGQNQSTIQAIAKRERNARALADSLASRVPVITMIYEEERSKGIFSKKILVLKDSTMSWGLPENYFK